ncbi:DUF7546 family protein [Natrinema soli]|uniref:DUF7546 family protein n=1 Tax=Natrinema soli TaxID=1930624 RepID=UPI003CCD412C
MTQPTFESNSLRRLLLTATWFNTLFAIQIIGGLIYAYVTGDIGVRITHFLIPFIWTTVSVWVIWHTHPVSVRPFVQFLAAISSITYLLLLLYLSGLIGPGTSHLGQLTGTNGIGMTWGRSLGWSPVFLYTGDFITLTVIPYQLAGLLAMSYLVYDALLDLARSAIGGVLGIAACPACVGPLFAPLLTSGVSGSSTVLLLGVYGYETATVLFIAAVGILYHRHKLSDLYRRL